MYTKDGFHKALEQKLGDDAYLLLAAGGHKKLADLLTSASLGASGNNTTLSVTVGGTTKTGSVTVPYASKAGTWETGRTLTIGSSGKSVNGSANVTWSLDEIGVYSKTAADDRYVNVTGDTMTGHLIINATGSASNSPLAVGYDSAHRNINTSVADQTTMIQVIAGTGGSTNSSAIGFHNPGISSAVLEYRNTDANTGSFNFRSDNTTWRVGIGTTSPIGKLHVVNSSGTSNSNFGIYIQENTNAWATRSLEILAPNLTSGSSPFIVIGKADSAKNMAWIGYVHNTDGGNANRLSFGLHSVDSLLNIFASGQISMFTASPNTYTKLHINGNTLGTRIWLNHNSNLDPNYSWTGAALVTPTIEVLNYNGTVNDRFPTITLHHYGYGGPRLSSKEGIMYIYGGNTDAKTLGSKNSYFKSLKIYPNETDGLYINDNKVWHAGNDGSGSGLDADLLDGYHSSSFSLSTHTHTFNLGSTTITTNGNSYSGITGPFNIYTNASSSNAFAICRGSLSEGVQHWVDDGQYHIDYTNDETSSSIHIRIINTDIESGNKTNTTDYHYYLDCYGNFYPGSNNTGSIGTSGYKWANMYATTFHGSLDGNASTSTKLQTARTIWGQSFDGTGNVDGKLTINDNITGGGTTNSLLNILFNGTHEYGVVMKIHSYGNDSPGIRFSHSSSSSELNSQVNTNWTVGMYYNDYYKFAITQDRGTNGWGTHRLVIDNSGRIGIGTDSPSYTLDVRGTTRSTDRIYANEWIQFDNWTGLYSPNNGAHFYPNNTTSYGAWQLRGSRNGYSGIHFGDSTGYMTIMDNQDDKGLYEEDWNWILYFNRRNKKLSFRTSSDLGADNNFNGSITAWNFRIHGSAQSFNCNDVAYTGLWYYSSNGPSSQLGARSTDGALYSQAYSTSWVGQIAQDYRDGGLYVRGKNNNNWQKWLQVMLVDLTSSAVTNCNSVYRTGIYTHSGFSNRPSGVSNWGTLLNYKLYEDNNNYHRQIFLDCYGTNRIWTRANNGGTWTDWVELVRNTGTWGISITGSAGSAGNADTVDGYHASGLFETLSFSGSTLTVKIGGTQKTCTISVGTTFSLNHQRVSDSTNRYVLGTTLTNTSASSLNGNTIYSASQFYFTSSGAYHTSDIRKKYDIRDIYTDEVTRLFNTDNAFIRHFKWKDTNHDAYGFIAQELVEYCPEAVDLNNDTGYYAVNYNVAFSKIIGAMYKRVKQLENENSDLKLKIEDLYKLINTK